MASEAKAAGKGIVPPQQELVRCSLEHIISSAEFARSPRLQKFLSLIVETAIRDESDQLKETIIGIEVYDRSPSYDPQLEPIVRTEARRLGKKLADYYQHAGRHDRVIISVPMGSYAPRFEIRDTDGFPSASSLIAPAPSIPTAGSRPDATSPALSVPPSSRLLFMGVASVGLLLLLSLVLFFGIESIRSSHEASHAARERPFTRYQGDALQPTISPDGKHVAFVWNGADNNFDIYTKSMDAASPTRITTNPAHDVNPSWSPDGTQLAFLRVHPDNRKEVYVTPAVGGAEHLIVQIQPGYPIWVGDVSIMLDHSAGPVWSPDGRYLAVSDATAADQPTAIYLASVQTGQKTRITTPPSGEFGDYFPAFSPNGRMLAFARSADRAEQCDIYILDLNTKAERQITRDHRLITGPAWLSNDRLIYVDNSSGAPSLMTVSLNGDDARPVPGASRGVVFPAASRDGKIVLYSLGFRNTNIWRAPLGESKDAAALAAPLITSSTKNDSAQYSPDGKRIVFVTDRSGTQEIWTSNADGSAPSPLVGMNNDPLGTPRWSPDGTQIVFDATVNGHSAIYVAPVNGGKPRLLAGGNKDAYMMPSWSRDGRSVYYSIQTGTGTNIWKLDLNQGTATQLTHHGGREVQESWDGSTVYFLPEGPGIWRVPANGGGESPVPGLENPSVSRHFWVAKTGIYFLSSASPPWTISLYHFDNAKITPVARIQKSLEFMTPSLTVSPDEKSMLYTQLDQSGYDLSILDNLRP
jgi:Tol biopolymer transport system component